MFLMSQVACMDISVLSSEAESSLLALGMWGDLTARLLSLPHLKPLCVEELGGDIIPRSMLKVTFEGDACSEIIYYVFEIN